MKIQPPETPFPRHWFAYLALKIGVLALAVLVVLYLFGVISV